MAKMDKNQIKELLARASEVKARGGSLSKVFEDFAGKTGRAKGSVRNIYYSTLQEMAGDDEYRREMLCGNKIEVARIIGFEDAESDLLLRKILTGATFGKSVRRAIYEMTDNPKLALRYQNKYRNLLKFDRQRVLRIRQEIIEDYGKCYEPYKQKDGEDLSLIKLKQEINVLYDKIASGVKQENKELRERVKLLENENSRLQSLLNANGKNSAKDFFSSSLSAKSGV